MVPVSDWAQIRAGTVLYEDDAALVLNKPAGLAVMGERHDTDLVRLAEDAGEKLYPAHRIDKVTSGALLLAKDLSLHGDLTRQFSRRTVDKVYLAITPTAGLPARGTIELPLSVGRKNRVRVAANRAAIAFDPTRSRWSVPPDEQFQEVRTYPSTTTFLTVAGDEEHTLLAVCPVTGRRHQIRVHLAWIGHPIEGDPLFGRPGRGCPGPDTAALVAARVRRGMGWRQAHPGRGTARARLLGRHARRCGPAARLGRDPHRLTRSGSGRRRTQEDAERMPGRVGVDAQRLIRVCGPVVDQPGAEGQGPPVRRTEFVRRGHVQVQVHLLRHRAVRPGRLRQLRNLLEREADRARGVLQDQPVLARRVGLARGRGLITRPVLPAQELPVELGQFPDVGAVQDDLPQQRIPSPCSVVPCCHGRFVPAPVSSIPLRFRRLR